LIVAEGLAQTAIHTPTASSAILIEPLCPRSSSTNPTQPEGQRQPSAGRSVLSVLRAVYECDKLAPVMPYDPNALLSKRVRDLFSVPHAERAGELVRLCSLWAPALPSSSSPDALAAFEQDIASRVEECMQLALLLTFGTGKAGRKPRLDFFLMHTLNSSLFLAPSLAALRQPEHKSTFLQAWLRGVMLYVLLRGRPRIDPELLMSYDAFPQPPGGPKADKPSVVEHGNPWPHMLASVLYAPDSHTIKAMRSLVVGEQRYGTTPPGGVIGAYEEDGKTETHKGASKLDGTMWVRAAGVLMNTMGWLDHGDKEGDWDRSALGWDAAWDNED
jgi:hypothetical protein